MGERTYTRVPEVTFIIPIIRNDFYKRCIDTLYKYTDVPFNLFVIDQTEQGIPNDPRIHLLIRPYRNLGFSKAINTGIKLAQTPYICALNDDVEFINKKWWQGILDTFATDEKIIAVSPMSPKEGSWGYGYREDNKDTWQPREGFACKEGDKSAVYPVLNGEPLFYKEEFSEGDYDNLLNHHPIWVPGSVCDGIPMWCPVFKRDKLFEIGVFDERFYSGGGEDYDLLGRAYSCGFPEKRVECDSNYHYRMVGTSRSWAYHHWGQSKDEISAKDPGNPLFASRPRWNNLDELWPKDMQKDENGNPINGFDQWGHGHRTANGKDITYPYWRDPVIFEDEI